MPNSIIGPRKRRTRQHVIADLSVHYVEGFILEEGHTAQRLSSDYSYDLVMRTFDGQGYVEPGPIYFQLKAAETLPVVGRFHVYDIDIRDYNLWMHDDAPVILILFDASRRKAYWLWIQKYFDEASARQPKKGAKFVRVRIPRRQLLNRRAVQTMRAMKFSKQEPVLEVVS